MKAGDYAAFLQAPSARQWLALGVVRRAGTCAPLFSLHSKGSVGIGEFPDLEPLSDWLKKTGQSLLQLLPLNDVGYDFAPYSAKSSFALDPMYISLDRLRGVNLRFFKNDIATLRARFPIGTRVNYGIKAAKMELLWKIYKTLKMESASLDEFRRNSAYWRKDDALYKVLKDRFHGKSWEDWEPAYRDREPEAIARLAAENARALAFHEWVQWQAFEQLREVKAYAAARGVRLMGDMPFLVARDSADVWAHPGYFKRHLAAGAPPDLYFAGGQRWGMPPYDWPALEANGFDYLKEKLRCAEKYYDLFRVDHMIGVFRVYTIALDSPAERGGLDGVFDPPGENHWEGQGRRILGAMLDATAMLPCGEDLGVVPACSNKVLDDLAIPGLEVQRWSRDWKDTKDFRPARFYRKNACAVASTHDMAPLADWWNDEAGTVDDYFFKLKCEARGFSYDHFRDQLFEPPRLGRLRWRAGMTAAKMLEILGLAEESARDFLDIFAGTADEREKFWRHIGLPGEPSKKATPEFIRAALAAAAKTASVFSVQLLFDWFSLDPKLGAGRRVNIPGTVAEENWSVVSPLSVEALRRWPGNQTLKRLHREARRV